MNWQFWRKPKIIKPEPEPELPVAVVQQKLIVIRPTKWVAWADMVGIVVSMDGSGYVVVDQVAASGETVRQHRVHGGMLRLARLQQIPESRRPANAAYAATLGYV